MPLLEHALSYIIQGMAPIPIPHAQKAPIIKGWTKLRLTEAEARAHFREEPQNIGILLGEPSRNLTDIDLDCEETVALAKKFLPETNCIFGRQSKLASHWIYRTDQNLKTIRYQESL